MSTTSTTAAARCACWAKPLQVRCLELLGDYRPIPQDGYQGEYLRWVAWPRYAEYGDAPARRTWTSSARKAVDAIFADIRCTLDRLGIRFDVYYNELGPVRDRQGQRGRAGAGQQRLCLPEGRRHLAARHRPGAKQDRVIIKSTGEPIAYRMPDIAYHVEKMRRGFDFVVDIFGEDHHATWPDVLAGVRALGYNTDGIKVIIHQFITLLRGGEEVKMSTRRGQFVTIDDLLDDVTTETIPGKDVVRFTLLTRSPDSSMTFDLDLAVKQSSENPVYYVQYGHARICSICARRPRKVLVSIRLAPTRPAGSAMATDAAGPSSGAGTAAAHGGAA